MRQKENTIHQLKYTQFCGQVNPLLRQAWVDLLDRYEWTWFTTLTWRSLPRTYTCLNQTKKWLTAIKKEEKRSIPYFLCLEWTRLQNRPHTHLLMANLESIRRNKWWSIWFTWYGAARILPYQVRLGASYYLTKYVVKDVYQSGMFEIQGLKELNQLKLKGVD